MYGLLYLIVCDQGDDNLDVGWLVVQEYLAGVLHILNGIQLHHDGNVTRKVRYEKNHLETKLAIYYLGIYVPFQTVM